MGQKYWYGNIAYRFHLQCITDTWVSIIFNNTCRHSKWTPSPVWLIRAQTLWLLAVAFVKFMKWRDVNSEDQRKKTVETVGHRVTLYLLWQVKVRSCVFIHWCITVNKYIIPSFLPIWGVLGFFHSCTDIVMHDSVKMYQQSFNDCIIISSLP